MYKTEKTTNGVTTIQAGGLTIGLRGVVYIVQSGLSESEQLRLIHALLRPMHGDFDLHTGKQLLEHVRTALSLRDMV